MKSFEELRVGDVMTTGVISCSPETPLREVAELMASRRVHAVFVFADGDQYTTRLWGLVSDLDLVAGAWAGAAARTAGELAVAPLVSIYADEPLARAAMLMAEYGVGHLAVVDPDDGRPAGVVSTLDLARAVAGEPATAHVSV
ncbi:MAG: CBS domain-containing protein [Actinobacteria bacterium]|nr:CBS domain-containing protein [Actinomycetota bacterium]MBV8395067.1 CBS domain-containing protein [Actinomycetota bacterium]MBV8598761.1 CBS domain-containing protein [Actinomycetota bacterium]